MIAIRLFALTSLLAVAQAQSQCASVALAIPACATSCLQSAATKVGCGPLDFACQCGPASSAAINSAAFGCVLSTCGPQTGLAVQTSAAAVCACAASAGPAASGSSSAVVTSMAGSSVAGGSSTAPPKVTSSGGAASAGSSVSMAGSTAAASMASSAAPAGSSAASGSGASIVGAGFELIVTVGAGLAVFLGVVAML